MSVRLRGVVPREYCLSQNIPHTQYRLSFISDLLETQRDPSTDGARALYRILRRRNSEPNILECKVHDACKNHVSQSQPTVTKPTFSRRGHFKRDAGDLVPFRNVARVC